jgi:chemotaxis protein histidine kinase CheA
MKEVEHEIIPPRQELRNRLGGPLKPLDEQQIENVQSALQELASGMGEWLKRDLEQLVRARNAYLDDSQSADRIKDLHRASHDLKGLGRTYGFPSVSAVADTLCTSIERLVERGELSEDLVNAYVDAMRAIVNLDLRDPNSAPVAELLSGLVQLAGKKLA